jgi:hypothetical protein
VSIPDHSDQTIALLNEPLHVHTCVVDSDAPAIFQKTYVSFPEPFAVTTWDQPVGMTEGVTSPRTFAIATSRFPCVGVDRYVTVDVVDAAPPAVPRCPVNSAIAN